MNLTETYKTIFKKDITDGDTKAFLQNIVEEHPYFSAAHFFLLRQTKKDDDAYKSLAATNAVHFNNPLWLNYLLNVKEDEKKILENKVMIEHEVDGVTLNNETEVQVCDANEVEKSENADEPKENTKESVLTAEQMLFEPMHMVDYFASQGIKLTEDQLGTDKLSKQLKSFTQWLKTMKKVHPEKMATSPAVETNVVNLAEKSNAENEILTEAMAEVFAMQGKTDKAVELFEKLSLQNPSKSAYFAAKIELLKA